MKIRAGFVSNSSSSSFMCLVTGDLFGGMDAGVNEFGADECENNHIFYDDYLVDEPNKKVYAEWVRKELKTVRGYGEQKGEFYYQDFLDLIDVTNTDISDDDALVALFAEEGDDGDYDYTPSFKCPICSLTHIQDKTRLDFSLGRELNFSHRDEIDKSIRACYTTLQEFEKSLVPENEDEA